jgi:hypothetical protein
MKLEDQLFCKTLRCCLKAIKQSVIAVRNEAISILYRAALQIQHPSNRLAYVEIASFLAMTLCFCGYIKTRFNHF